MISDKSFSSELDSVMATALLAISRATIENHGDTRTPGKQEIPGSGPVAIASSANPKIQTDFATSSLGANLEYQLALQAAGFDATKNSTLGLNNFMRRTLSAHSTVALNPGVENFNNNIQSTSMVSGSHCTPQVPFGYLSQLPHVVVEATRRSSDVADDQTIRQKEIEKALRSKSQRGRKRANLNEIERLELTRTRNREHAKSTRIRKKQRYEELLDYEKKVHEIETQEKLLYRRICCIVSF